MVVVIVLIALVVLLVAGVTFVAVGRARRGGVELEPPATPTLRRATAPGPTAEPTDELVAEVEDALAPVAEPEVLEAPRRPSFRERLSKARGTFAGFLGRTKIDEGTWDELEEALLRADVGIGPTTELVEVLRARVKAEGLDSASQLIEAVKDEMKQRLAVADRSLRFDEGRTNVWLFVGVNGVGKTTTVGKVGKHQAAEGRRVVMAAGDTFRAAAAEQLTTWAERAGADLVRGAEGADPSSIIFDAIESAAAKGADLVLADTAGRLHTKTNLMEELRKVKRVASKEPGHVTEVLLVLDATTGQNGLVQAKQFTEAVEVTGVVLTKLDGSAKGGIVFAIQSQLGIPVKLVGLGETADDLVDFDPDEFVEALFAT
ncbi:MAG: ftsY [Acidimicrobiales bacterium]|nr:ftsY [Acidimicrobiales bacterium]